MISLEKTVIVNKDAAPAADTAKNDAELVAQIDKTGNG